MPFSWAATARDTASELFPVPPFWVTNATTCMHGPSTTHVRVSYPKVNKLLHAASRKRQTASGLRRAVDGIRHTVFPDCYGTLVTPVVRTIFRETLAVSRTRGWCEQMQSAVRRIRLTASRKQ